MSMQKTIIVVLALGSSAWAATFNVNSTQDAVDATPGDGICASAAGVCTLRSAIQEANALAGDDLIEVPAGVYYLTIGGVGEDAGATGDLDVTAGLTLRGVGSDSTTVDGLGSDRVLHVLSGTFYLQALTIRGGNTTGDAGGGLLHADVQSLSIVGVRFEQNLSVGGGALRHSRGTTTLTDCTFLRNSSLANGGAIEKTSGTAGALHMTRCQFIENAAATAGGAVFYSGPGPVTAEACTFDSNQASVTGGAVEIHGSAGLTSNNSIFTGNRSVGAGGSILHGSGGPLTLGGDSFTDSSSGDAGGGVYVAGGGTLTVSASVFRDCTATVGGGLYGATGGEISISSTTLEGNRALSGPGGAALLTTGSPVTLSGLVVMGNSSADSGGGFRVTIGGLCRVVDCAFTANRTLSTGGGLYASGGAGVDLIRSRFTENSAVSDGTGAGAFLTGAMASVEGCLFAGNDAQGGSATGGGLRFSAGGTTPITNCTFSGNTSGLTGGGLSAGSPSTLTNCTFGDNLAGESGGNLYNVAPTIITNTVFAAALAGQNCGGPAPRTSGGGNISSDSSCGLAGTGDLVDTDPLLGLLANNGGPMATRELLTGSPAVDFGVPGACPALDQRNLARPVDGDGDGTAVCDSGAFEVTDCNANGTDDRAELARGGADCNANLVPDNCESPDTDANGIADMCDLCTDTDGDGFGDPGFAANTCTEDGCPADATKSAAGQCGCGNPDTDSDADGSADCNDGCPADPAKTAAGTCGCGTADTDSDGDGTPDCIDSTPQGAVGFGCAPLMPSTIAACLLGLAMLRMTSTTRRRS